MSTSEEIDRRLLLLAVTLIRRTESGEIKWSEGIRDESFNTIFRGSSVDLIRHRVPAYTTDEAGNDYEVSTLKYKLRLSDRLGQLRAEISDARLDEILRGQSAGDTEDDIPRNGFMLLDRLYMRASESANDIEGFLAELLADETSSSKNSR